MRTRIRVALVGAVLGFTALAPPSSLSGQDGQLRAHRIPATGAPGGVPTGSDSTRVGAEPFRLDGLLSESFWQDAQVVSGFVQREPSAGDPARDQTEVRVAYDGEALYIGVTAFDSEPDRVVARILQRDKLLEKERFDPGMKFAGDDAIAILFDPFHDHRTGMVFATNANGAEFEALLSDEGSDVNIDWRGVWEVASARTDQGWSTEFAIPWRTLRYPDPEDAAREPWGFNVYRVNRRTNEETLWQSWQREGGGFHRVSRAGHLSGLDGIPGARLNFESKPFALVGLREEADDVGVVDRASQQKFGFDIKSELRPGLLLDLTVNTDFAQVEVDDEQVNLTRFSLFFPEKRDFFLENAGIFEFGKAGNDFEPPAYQMLFSRQIGIHEDGEVPIFGGARVTGRVGSQTIGFLSVLTDEAFDTPRETFNVGRIKRDVGESAYVGGMIVDRRSSDGTNTNVGVDGQFTIGEAWTWDWYAAQSFTDGAGGEGYSYRLAYRYFGDSWGSFFDHYVVSPNAQADAGFVLREDIRSTQFFGSHTFRPSSLLGLREISTWTGGSYGTTVSDGRLQDWEGGVGLNPKWNSGDEFTLMMNVGESVVDESFELTDSVSVHPGRYRADHVSLSGGTSQSRPIHLRVNGRIANFFGGSLLSGGGTLTMSPSAQVSLGLGYTRNRVEVPGGEFTADISSVRATYSASTKMSANVLVQYNSLDRAFSTNLRFNFIHRPGSDLFIVFTENRGDENRVWEFGDRGLVMKVTYLIRL